MRQAYRRWVCGLLACLLTLLALCGAFVYAVDPCLYYRVPDKWQPILFNERYQMAGLAKNVEADTVLLGTSMAANYRASWIGETFGTPAVRLTIPDGYYSEFDRVMEVLFRAQSPERVIFGMDLNTLIRDESGVTSAMPDYLYNANPLDDIQYLLNKDTLYYSAYTLLSNRWGEGDTIDEGFTWDKDQWWNHMSALANYDKALELCPTLVDAWVRKGVTLHDEGAYYEAAHCLNEAVRLSPRLFKAVYNRGKNRLAMGDVDGAVADLDRATSLNADHIRAHELYGDALSRSGKTDEAAIQWAIAERLREKKNQS